jgi:replication-associated recombination protein RarA
LVAVEDVGIASPEIMAIVDATLGHGERGTDSFKRSAFVGIAEMAVVILLARAPKCHTATNALLTCAKTWLLVERGEIDPPPVPAFAIDAHTKRGKAMGVPRSAWWSEAKALAPKGKTHAENGGDPFADIEGDVEVLGE